MSAPLKLLDALEGVRQEGEGEWRAKCPLHEDGTASLMIKVGDGGRVLLNCHAGCLPSGDRDRLRPLLEAIGLRQADLESEGRRARQAKPEIAEAYDYTDEQGGVLFQVVRFVPKDFRQRRSNGHGGWDWKTRGTRKALYRLPKVRGAVEGGARVYLVEGEKDVHALERLGLAATTKPGGAKARWLQAYTASLKGAREVVILPDNDDPGRSAAAVVAAAIAGSVELVRVLELPNLPTKGDASDWIRAGGTRAELEQLVDLCPPWSPDDGSVPAAAATESEDDGAQFFERDGCTWWRKRGKEGITDVLLGNFTARILAVVERDDGAEIKSRRDVQVTVQGRAPVLVDPQRGVPVDQFSSLRWVDKVAGAIISSGHGKRDRLREAVQRLSGHPAVRRTYCHTGWRKLGGEWAFLHAGGALGKSGPVAGIDVDLPPGLDQFDLPSPPTGPELARCLQESLRLLELAPDVLTVPGLGAVFRVPLGEADHGLWVVGETGRFKSEFAARLQQFFGAGMHRKGLPASWMSTANALEELAFLAKDVLLVVDDYKPAAAGDERLNGVAERLFRGLGNSAGRGRLNSAMEFQAGRPPRGLLAATAEDLPRGHSLRARVLVLEVGAGDVDMQALTAAQRDGAAGAYAHVMAAYLSWLAPRIEKLRSGLEGQVTLLRSGFSTKGTHGRTADAAASLLLGWITFLEFAVERGGLDPEQSGRIRSRVRLALAQLVNDQSGHQSDQEPAERFVGLLRSGVSSGRAHLASSKDGRVPPEPESWGWRACDEGRSLDQAELDGEAWTGRVRTTWEPQGKRVGWVCEEDVYLDPEAAFGLVVQLARELSDPFPITLRTLIKRMAERGLLVGADGNTHRPRRTVHGTRRRVLNFRVSDLREGGGQVEPDHWPGSNGLPGQANGMGGNGLGAKDQVGQVSLRGGEGMWGGA